MVKNTLFTLVTLILISFSLYGVNLNHLLCSPNTFCSRIFTNYSQSRNGATECVPVSLSQTKDDLLVTVRDIDRLIQHQEVELVKPDNLRERKDSRGWLGKIFKSENPVEVSLRNNIRISKRQREVLNQSYQLLKEAEITLDSARGKLENYPEDIRSTISWFQTRIREFQQILGEKGGRISHDGASEGHLKLVEKATNEINQARIDLAKLQKKLYDFVYNPKQNHSFFLNYLKEAQSFRKQSIQNKIKQVQDRTLKPAIVESLLNLAIRYNKPDTVIVEWFLKIDKLAAEKRSSSENGLNDRLIPSLIQIGLEHSLTPEMAVSKFVSIDVKGNNFKESFSVYDAEVMVLLDTTLSFKVTEQQAIERFFTFYENSRQGPKKDKFYFDDPSLAILTYLSFEHKTDVKSLSQLFFEIDKSTDLKKDWWLYDTAVAILIEGAIRFKTDPVELENAMQSLYKSMKSKDVEVIDEDVARALVFSKQFKISPSVMVDLLKHIQGKQARGMQEVLSSIGIAIAAKYQTVETDFMRVRNWNEIISSAELDHALSIPHLNMSRTIDLLYSHRKSSSSSRSSNSGMPMYSLSNPLNVYNLATGGGMDGNIITPW